MAFKEPEPIPLDPSERNWRDQTMGVSDGFDVWRWPEFQALALRLGIALELDTKAVTIRIAVGEQPHITQEYSPREPKEMIDTSNLHNDTYKTFVPSSHGPKTGFE